MIDNHPPSEESAPETGPTHYPPCFVTVTKVTDLGTIPEHPIFTGYTVAGWASMKPTLGWRYSILRTNRNGIERLGIFETSPVASAEQVSETRTVFKTANSQYVLDAFPDRVYSPEELPAAQDGA